MTEVASRRSFARYVSIETTEDLCSFVDELAQGEAGQLVFDGERTRGTVYIEDARVCWAAAEGLSARLTELLVARSTLGSVEMELLYRRCKSEGTPLGEYLVGTGIVSANDLRSALARHTVESIGRLASSGSVAAWCPRPRGGYSPRFTFGTSEVLARAGAAGDESRSARAAEELEACFSEGEWACALVRDATRAAPSPIALHGDPPAAARELARVAKWAVSSLDMAEAFRAMDAMLAVELPRARRTKRREVLVAFRHEGLVYVGEATTQAPARILHRRTRTKRQRG